MSLTPQIYRRAEEIAAIDQRNLEQLDKIARNPQYLWAMQNETIKADGRRAAILRQQLRDITTPEEYRAAMRQALDNIRKGTEAIRDA